MKALYALYSDPDSAQRAVNGLRAAGVAEHEITVISSEPFEEHDFSHAHKATWMYWFACLGGLIGLTVGSWLTRMTETSWPLPTGGMPIVAMWPNLIIIFELTMLGGILATVTTLLISARIPGRPAAFYDPEVVDGKIIVGVANPPDASVGELERALKAVSGGQIKSIG